MANIDTLLGLLQLVASSGGEVDSRIRLQKEAYLLSILGRRNFRTSAFEYHHYGPYSRELSDALQDAVLSRLLNEKRDVLEDGSYIKYSYKITDAGYEYLADAGGDVDAYKEYIKVFAQVHWRALELAATVKFLELEEEVRDRVSAFQEAIELKPQTKKYRGDAEKILSSLSL